MKKVLLLSAMSIFFASCGIYQSHFDCPAGEGVGCKSVNEVLGMIVEKEEGEDLFVQDEQEATLLKAQEKKKRKPKIIVEEETDPSKLYLLKESSGERALIIQAAP